MRNDEGIRGRLHLLGIRGNRVVTPGPRPDRVATPARRPRHPRRTTRSPRPALTDVTQIRPAPVRHTDTTKAAPARQSRLHAGRLRPRARHRRQKDRHSGKRNATRPVSASPASSTPRLFLRLATSRNCGHNAAAAAPSPDRVTTPTPGTPCATAPSTPNSPPRATTAPPVSEPGLQSGLADPRASAPLPRGPSQTGTGTLHSDRRTWSNFAARFGYPYPGRRYRFGGPVPSHTAHRGHLETKRDKAVWFSLSVAQINFAGLA
jgi:hypothetical protein